MSVRLRRLTPRARGGVALLRVEGLGAAVLLARLVRRPLPAPGRVRTARLVDRDGEDVDDVLVARESDDAFEVGCHGGPAVVEGVVSALRGAGAREVAGEPELAGVDRTQAEARALLARATTELGCRVLLAQAAGALARALDALDARLDADPQGARAALDALVATWPLGRALLEPPRVAIVGLPNAGKSSLMNALLGRERVLVAPEAGTTRDAVEDVADLDGVPARLVDTAGQRDTADPLEAEGIARAQAAARGADVRLVVIDATGPTPTALSLARAAAPPRLVALNKDDLLDGAARARALEVAGDLAPLLVSATSAQGLEALRATLRVTLVGEARADDGPVLVTVRQLGLAQGALRALARGDLERARTCVRALRG